MKPKKLQTVVIIPNSAVAKTFGGYFKGNIIEELRGIERKFRGYVEDM